ncbi:hypothetical protein [Priestia megaterium]|uniref:hypothetical protein n=1 Tax=Priestia megaterium TaxID=1404 RepID=UPI00285834CD|nr:hypothetical protein [Priestia megaterium]MDR7246320.1 hypothetical protein [Priestia megaterium]
MSSQREHLLINELDSLLSGKSMKKLSGIPKKCYKYALTAAFVNICNGKQLTRGQEGNFEWIYNIKNNPKNYNSDQVLNHVKRIVEKSLKEGYFYNYNDYQTIDNIIKFFREVINITKKQGTCLINLKELEELFDIKKSFLASHKNLQPHHWVEISLFNGMIITVPEFFTYSDLVNTWNMLVDKIEEYRSVMNADNDVPFIEKKNNIEIRQLRYEMDTLSRSLWISSVTFVESYLYYVFYNLKQINYQPNSQSGKSILTLQKVEDEEIIKRLIIPEFVSQKNKELDKLIKEYLVINKIRNRFIHTSAFKNTVEISELLPLLTTTVKETVDALETCRKLVECVDSYLPKENKILIWWDRISHPNFKEFKKGSITNPNSLLSTVKYEDYVY